MRTLTSAFLVVLNLAAAASAATTPASPAATLFSDDACPQANGPSRTLNGTDPAAPGASDTMLSAANGIIAAYKDCADAFDREARTNQADSTTDYVVVHRSYARLQLARAYQRVASFDAQLKNPSDAAIAYGKAIDVIAEIDQIVGNSYMTNGGSEGKLVREAHDLRDQIDVARAALNVPSPSPGPSASP